MPQGRCPDPVILEKLYKQQGKTSFHNGDSENSPHPQFSEPKSPQRDLCFRSSLLPALNFPVMTSLGSPSIFLVSK